MHKDMFEGGELGNSFVDRVGEQQPIPKVVGYFQDIVAGSVYKVCAGGGEVGTLIESERRGRLQQAQQSYDHSNN